MSLSSISNTINALGIFGRLSPELENYFLDISEQYSKYLPKEDVIGIFNHLSLVIGRNVLVSEISTYLDLLKQLKPFLPVELNVLDVIVKDHSHLALAFNTSQTQQIRDLASTYLPQDVVTTYYTKVVWYVPPDQQAVVKEELRKVQKLIFGDFYLVANRQDEAHTIYTAKRF